MLRGRVTHAAGRREKGAAGNGSGGAWGGFARDPWLQEVIVGIPGMTAIPGRLRLPGGAAGLAGPVGPW